MVREALLHIGPWLMVIWFLSAIFKRYAGKKPIKKAIALALAATVISFTPLGQLSLAEYILSFLPSFSGGSIFIFILLIARNLFNKNLLYDREETYFLIAGAGYTSILTLSSLGILPFDLYSYGYGDTWVIALLLFIAVFLIIAGSNIIWWVIVAQALWVFSIIPSGNLHDALTDFVFLIACVSMLALRGRGLLKPGGV